MKKSLIALAALASVSVMSTANADMYVSWKMGYAQSKFHDLKFTDPSNGTLTKKNDKDWNANYGIAFGFSFRKYGAPARVEVELMNRPNVRLRADTSSGGTSATNNLKMSNQTFMVNGYYDFLLHSPIKPFVTIGGGYSRVKTSGSQTVSGTATDYRGTQLNSFAWNVGLGATFLFTPNFGLDAEYRYVNLGNFSAGRGLTTNTAQNLSGKLVNNEFIADLRYMF